MWVPAGAARLALAVTQRLLAFVLLALCLSACRAMKPPATAAVTPKWTFEAGAPKRSDSRRQAPAIGDDGTVYVGGRALFAVRPDGSVAWEYDEPFTFRSPLMDDTGQLWAGSPISGWVHRIDQGGGGTPLFGGGASVHHLALDHAGRVYSVGHKLLMVIRTADGTLDDSRNFGFVAAAVGRGGRVYLVSAEDVELFDGKGSRLWWSPPLRGCGPPALDDSENVYVGCHSGLVSFTADGKPRWTYTVNGAGSPSIGSDGSVYFGASDGTVYAVTGRDGHRVWSFRSGGEVKGAPAVASDGTVYVGTEKGVLYALGPDGSLRWSFPAAAPLLSPTIAPDGTVYVQSATGVLYAFAQGNGGLAGSPWPKLCGDLRNTCRLALAQ